MNKGGAQKAQSKLNNYQLMIVGESLFSSHCFPCQVTHALSGDNPVSTAMCLQATL